MRKLFASILAIVLMTTTTSIAAYADTYSQLVDSETGCFSGETSIDYHIYSSYYVTIPTSISEYDSYGEVSVTMDNIEQGYHVDVSITNLDEDGFLAVTSDNGDTSRLSVMHDSGLYMVQQDGLIKRFSQSDYLDGGVAATDISFGYSGNGSNKAGVYHGTVCFRVECLPD